MCRFPVCVARFNAVLYRFWYRHQGKGGGGGEGAITCRLLAWLQSPIVNQEIPEGGMAEVGRGKEEMERPNKVVSIFMSF